MKLYRMEFDLKARILAGDVVDTFRHVIMYGKGKAIWAAASEIYQKTVPVGAPSEIN